MSSWTTTVRSWIKIPLVGRQAGKEAWVTVDCVQYIGPGDNGDTVIWLMDGRSVVTSLAQDELMNRITQGKGES